VLAHIKFSPLPHKSKVTYNPLPVPSLTIKSCPLCRSRRITKVHRTLTRQSKGIRYQVPDLEFYECPNCRQRFFDRAASRKIDACSPAFSHRTRRKSA